MRTNTISLLASLLGLLLCVGCTSAGLRTSIRNQAEQDQRDFVKKVVCINPIYSSNLRQKHSAGEAIIQYEKRNAKLQDLLLDNAEKAKVTLEIIDGNHLQPADQKYFNQLAPLLNEMINAMAIQGDRYTTDGQHGTWERAPMVDSRFSILSKQFGTPYFMFTLLKGKGKSKVHTVWQAIVVNVEAGTLWQAEFRLSLMRPRHDLLDSMIYDFFNLLHHATN